MLWDLLWLVVCAVIAVTLGRARGRHEAIERYREECVNADKKAERQFTLLYVDEYRASNCNEAIRLIWGDE